MHLRQDGPEHHGTGKKEEGAEAKDAVEEVAPTTEPATTTATKQPK